MCDHDDREAAMPILSPGVWCDPCLVPLVTALNEGGLPTVASCCGHGHRPGSVSLTDGRTLLVLPDRDWDDRLADFIHGVVACKPGRECTTCATDGQCLAHPDVQISEQSPCPECGSVPADWRRIRATGR